MSKKKRRNISSPQGFVQAFNRHKMEFKNPKGEETTNLISIKLIGVDGNNKFKEQKVYLPQWTINAIQINFKHNRKISLRLSELEQQIITEREKQQQQQKKKVNKVKE